ncbi:MAG: sodium/proline symporter, partial [Acidobacteriota bacterium]|nr:sodium/proline symporter [Acidobacteriota bacterium]
AGGWGAVLGELRAFDPGLLDPFALTFGVAIGFVGIGLGSPGNPHILVRYMSIDDPRRLRLSALIGTAWNVVMAAGALTIGLVGRAYYATPELLPAADTENLYPALAQQHLPPVLFGVVIASIFAAIMSTADSQLLVAASGVVRDLWEKLLHRGPPLAPRTVVHASRAVIVVLVVLAILLGSAAQELVFWFVLFAWAGLGASLGPTSILSLYWERTTAAGVAAGMIAGTVTVIVWHYTPALRGAVYELVPAFAVGFLATVVVSLLTRPPEDASALMASMTAGGAATGTRHPEAD